MLYEKKIKKGKILKHIIKGVQKFTTNKENRNSSMVLNKQINLVKKADIQNSRKKCVNEKRHKIGRKKIKQLVIIIPQQTKPKKYDS